MFCGLHTLSSWRACENARGKGLVQSDSIRQVEEWGSAEPPQHTLEQRVVKQDCRICGLIQESVSGVVDVPGVRSEPRICGQKLPTAGTSASGSVAQGGGVER